MTQPRRRARTEKSGARTRTRVTDADRAEIRRLHGEGKSLRHIAGALDRSLSTTARHAKDMGLTFDHTQVEAATAAKVRDNRARRAALIESLYDLAEDDVAYLRQDGAYALTEVSAGQAVDYMVGRLPASDRRALIGAISTAMTAAARAEQVDSDEHGLPAVDTWLRALMGADTAGQ